MHTLHAQLHLDDTGLLVPVRAIRTARVLLVTAPEQTVLTAIADEVRKSKDGFVYVGQHDTLGTVQSVAAEMEVQARGTVQAYIDLSDDDRAALAVPAPSLAEVVKLRDEPEPAKPTPAVMLKHFSSALVLMTQTEGNPLGAAAQAHALARATGDSEMWFGVIRALVSVFPWMAETLKANGMLP